MKYNFFLLVCFLIIHCISFAQEKEVLKSADSLKTVTVVVDSTAPEGKKVKKVNVYNPRKAALRSAIIPGWGQIYNKKYWKLPIVYGALGTSAGVFFFNLKTYKDTRKAYTIKYNMSKPGATAADSARFNEIRDDLKPLSEGALRSYRDSYRRDIDYSVIFFVLLWGLNVVDAAVDAHLKSFDVSPDLSFRLKPGYSEMAGTKGLSFVVTVGKKKQSALLPSKF
ncbi:MAG: DUF5683 domain-containing protein [Chitinophagaceae bacterium]